jgi:hypothetical protein
MSITATVTMSAVVAASIITTVMTAATMIAVATIKVPVAGSCVSPADTYWHLILKHN